MSAKFRGFLTPSLPLSAFLLDLQFWIHTTSLTICLLLGHPSSPLGADVFYEASLMMNDWFCDIWITGINQAIPRALDWMCSLEENLEPMKFNVKWSAESIGKKINEIKVSQLIGEFMECTTSVSILLWSRLCLLCSAYSGSSLWV